MKRKLHKITSLLIALFMTLEMIMPSFYSMAKEDEKTDSDPYKIENLGDDDFGFDEASSFSIELATRVNEKNLDSKEKLSIALDTVEETQNFTLITRKDMNLFDQRSFDFIEDAEKEYNKTKENYEKQGLDLDISLVEKDDKYFIHNNSEDREENKNFGKAYKTYDFKVINDFDFDKKGLQNKIPEDIRPERLFTFNFEIKESIDKSQAMISLKDEKTEDEEDPDDDSEKDPIKIINDGDLLGIILDDEYYTTYTTDQIANDMADALSYKEDQKEKRQETEAKKKEEENKSLEEQEKTSSEDEDNEEEKDDKKEEKENLKKSETEIIVEPEKEEKTEEDKKSDKEEKTSSDDVEIEEEKKDKKEDSEVEIETEKNQKENTEDFQKANKELSSLLDKAMKAEKDGNKKEAEISKKEIKDTLTSLQKENKLSDADSKKLLEENKDKLEELDLGEEIKPQALRADGQSGLNSVTYPYQIEFHSEQTPRDKDGNIITSLIGIRPDIHLVGY